jgi:NhaP-type Na+/H+ or K+/H+ antiporter
MLILPWISYLLAESLELSGIVSIIFSGISMAHYSLPNMSKEAKQSIKMIYNTIGANCETLAFIIVGVSIFGFEHRFL